MKKAEIYNCRCGFEFLIADTTNWDNYLHHLRTCHEGKKWEEEEKCDKCGIIFLASDLWAMKRIKEEHKCKD